MRLSIAICTHNERDYIRGLLKNVSNWCLSAKDSRDPNEYEVIILDDYSTDEEVVNTLDEYDKKYTFIKVYKNSLNDDFANHKNVMNSFCSGDWILNLDGDETIPYSFLDTIPLIIESNPQVEAYWLPRVNTVDGITFKHLQQWKWTISTLDGYRTREAMDVQSEKYRLLKMFDLIESEENNVVTYKTPIVCWPDYQMRLYQNDKKIHWEGKVHEQLKGYQHFTLFPQDPQYAIQHHKSLERQELQNSYYAMLKGK